MLARLSEELYGNYTWGEITKRFNEETGKDVCKMTIFRFCKSRGWHEVCDKLTRYKCSGPLLLSLARKARVEGRKEVPTRVSRQASLLEARREDFPRSYLISGTITEVLVSIDFVTSSRKACTSRRYLTTYSVTSSNHCYGSS